MASPYHRQLPYEHNAAGPSRTNVPFERPQSGPRAAYSEHNYVENVDHHHSAPRRLDRPQVYYNPGGSDAYYATQIPLQERERAKWTRETGWYPPQPHPAPSSYVPRRPSPPPVHAPHPRSYGSPTPQSAYPPYTEWRNASPTRSAWEERRTWDPVHDEHVHESPSTWQQARPDSGSRLNDLLNPKTPSPPTDTRRWRPNEGAHEQHQGRNFVRSDAYTYDYRPPTQVTYYDVHDGRNQYVEPGHYRSHYEEERVIRARPQTYSDPAPRYNSNRHPAVQQTRPARPSALGDYKRQRYVSPPHQAEVAPASPPVWNRGHDKTWEWDRLREERERQRGYATREVLSNRSSFHLPGQAYSQYGYPNEAPRVVDELPYAVHTPSNSSRGPGGRDILNAAPVYSSSTAPLARPYPERPYDHGTRSNSDNGSEDEDSDVASSRASDAEIFNRAPTRDEQHHTNDAPSQEGHGPNRPTTPVRPGSSVNMDQASANRQFEPSVANLRSIVGTPAGRSGVMSVHALLTPTPERPSTARSIVTTVEGLLGPRVSPTPSAKSSVLDIKSLLTDEPPPFRPPPSQPTPENRPEPGTSQFDLPITQETTTIETTDDARVPLDEAPSLPPETIQVETPIAATPATLMETDAESRTLSGEREIERSRAASPRAPEPISRKAAPPAAEVVQAPHQNVILHPPQRVRPDAKMISDALKKVVLARNRLDKQSRDERVNPILMANLSLVSTPQSRTPTFPQTLVEEFRSKVLTIEDQELRMNARAVLAARFAEQRESLSEKVQRLRDEYLQHHRKWKAHCAELDAALKANAVEETTAATGRTTRRSAATHGDAVRSDLEMEQIIASLGNEDMTDPNQLAVRNVATIPDMISVEKGHVEYLFDDTNGFVEDPASFYDARSGFYDWTDEEKAIYLKKYAEFPKQFGQIASFLPNKTAKQCVLYYYLHKKRIIDFRAAVSSGHNRRRRGGRRGKQKSNALLVDIQGAEGEREKPAGGRRRRGGATGEGRGGRRAAAAQAAQNAQQTDQPAEGETRTRRRRGAAAVAAAKAAAQVRKEDEGEDGTPAAEDATEQQSEPAPPPKRQTRKPRRSTKPTESPAPAPATATETRFIDVNETLGRRKPAGNSSHWSDSDKEEFLKLLAQHGRNFKRIASSMPNKTTIQVQNFFKNHMVEMDLVRIADSAQGRSQSPDGSVPRDPFVNGSHIVTASNSAAPTPPVEPTPSTTPELVPPPPLTSQGEELNQPVNNKPMKREGTAGPPGTGMMTLGEPGPRHIWMTERFPFVNANTPGASRPVAPMLGAQPQMLNQKAYMGVLHPTPFQDSVQRPMVLPQPPTPIGWQKTQAQMQDLAQGFSPPPMLNVHVHPGDKKPVRIQPAPSRTPGTTIAYPYPLQPSPHPGSPLLQHPHIHTHPHIMPRGSPVMPGPSRNPHELIHSPPRATEQGQKASERSPPFTREPRDFTHT